MHWVEALIVHYGLVAVFLGTFIEGEAVLSLAGFLAHQGLMAPVAVAAVASLGAFAADQAWFHLARRHRDNPRVVRAAGTMVGRVALRGVVARRDLFCLGFRFLFGFKTVGPMMASVAGVAPLRFAVLDGLACVVWAAAWTILGFLFGRTIETLVGELGRFEHRVLAGAAIVALVLMAGHWIKTRELRSARDEDVTDSGK